MEKPNKNQTTVTAGLLQTFLELGRSQETIASSEGLCLGVGDLGLEIRI